MDISLITIGIVKTALLTAVAIVCLRVLAIKMLLVDRPSELKKHSGDVPLIGGIVIFSVLWSQFYFEHTFSTLTLWLFIGSLLITTLGGLDDLLNLGAKKRLLFMVITSAMIPIMTGLKITTLGDIFLLDFSLDFKFFSFPATVVAIVCLINAFNMMDGVDGLTASLAALVALAIMIACWGIIREDILFLLITFSVTLAVFLIFNLSNSRRFKIFLGDAGSTFLGFFVAINLIYAAENVPQFSIIMGAWVVAVPLFDFFAVIIQRLSDAKSPFKGDRNHLHHLLLAHGLNSKKTAMVILALACGLLFLGFVIETVLPEFSLPLFVVLFFVYLFVKRSQLTF